MRMHSSCSYGVQLIIDNDDDDDDEQWKHCRNTNTCTILFLVLTITTTITTKKEKDGDQRKCYIMFHLMGGLQLRISWLARQTAWCKKPDITCTLWSVIRYRSFTGKHNKWRHRLGHSVAANIYYRMIILCTVLHFILGEKSEIHPQVLIW